MSDVQLFPCYSVKLKQYLINEGLKYKIVALNPNNHKAFWVFIDDEHLKQALIKWKDTRPNI